MNVVPSDPSVFLDYKIQRINIQLRPPKRSGGSREGSFFYLSRLATYLGKITRNLSLDRLKQLNAQKRGKGQVELALQELESCIPSADDMDQIADEIVLSDTINQFLRAQPRTERNIFVGRYWHLYSISDLAQAYGMRESKVASLLFRMRQKLKHYLEKEGIYI